MRVLHLLNHVQIAGNGIVTVACDLACEQKSQGLEVAVASSGGALDRVLEAHGVRHFSVRQNKQITNLVSGGYGLFRLISKWKPDVIHAHMMTGVVLAWLNKPFLRFSLISTVHNEFQREAKLMGLADRVIAVSDAVREQMVARGIKKSKIQVVRNGVIGGLRIDESPVDTVIHRPSIMTVAGLNDRKGIPDLLAAFELVAAKHPTVHLYVIGDGRQKSEYLTLAEASQFNDRIHFMGFRPNVRSFLVEADMMVLPSHSEPFGLAIAEAREMGVAVIGTNVGGIPEALEFGKRGILVSPRDPGMLCEAILSLLENPELLAKWRTLAAQNLDWLTVKRMTAETYVVYEDALNAQGKPGIRKQR